MKIEKKFKKGDRVFHKRLMKVGVFEKYGILEEECFVTFFDEDGYADECLHVSTSQLIFEEQAE